MLKSARVPMLALATATAALVSAAPAHSAPVGPHAALCAAGKPGILARVTGFKSASGTVAVKLYNSNSKYLDSGAYIRKVEVPVTNANRMDICVPVPSSGRYVISVRHEIGAKKSRSDGGGLSGNPKVSLVSAVLGRKPDLGTVSFSVNGTTAVVPVVLNYVQGGSLKPVSRG